MPNRAENDLGYAKKTVLASESGMLKSAQERRHDAGPTADELAESLSVGDCKGVLDATQQALAEVTQRLGKA